MRTAAEVRGTISIIFIEFWSDRSYGESIAEDDDFASFKDSFIDGIDSFRKS
jgi:hypothetical protein